MTRRHTIEFVLLAAIWGSSFMLVQLGAAEFGAWPVAGLRVGIAALVMLPIALMPGHWQIMKQNALHFVVDGFFTAGLPFALFAFALTHLSTGMSSILNATTPLFGALVAWLWLKEKLDSARALGLLLGFVGVTVLSWHKANFHAGGSGWAVLACLGATLSYGISASYTRRYLSHIPPLLTATGNMWGASLALAWPTLWYWPAHNPSLLAWSGVLAAGVLCTGLAYLLFFRLLSQTGPSTTLSVTYLIPVFALGYGQLLLAETLETHMLLGGAVVLCGVALTTGVLGQPKKK